MAETQNVGGTPDVEVWMPVRGYSCVYEVSNLGRVRRVKPPIRTPGGLISPVLSKGYPFVSLSHHGKVKPHRVHVLVLTAFCGARPFEGAQAAHNDGDPKNCRLDNLRWATPIENQADVNRHGRRCRGEDVYGAVLTEPEVRSIRKRTSLGERNPSIAADFGVLISTIHLIRHNLIWRHVA